MPVPRAVHPCQYLVPTLFHTASRVHDNNIALLPRPAHIPRPPLKDRAMVFALVEPSPGPIPSHGYRSVWQPDRRRLSSPLRGDLPPAVRAWRIGGGSVAVVVEDYCFDGLAEQFR